MKRFSAALLALVLVTAAVSVVCFADQIAVPKTEAIFPGVTQVTYVGETFVFTTTVKLSARFECIAANQIRIQVRTYLGPRQEMELAPGPALRIYWEGQDETLYDGTPPEEWTGIVLTEGGLTEK